MNNFQEITNYLLDLGERRFFTRTPGKLFNDTGIIEVLITHEDNGRSLTLAKLLHRNSKEGKGVIR